MNEAEESLVDRLERIKQQNAALLNRHLEVEADRKRAALAQAQLIRNILSNDERDMMPAERLAVREKKSQKQAKPRELHDDRSEEVHKRQEIQWERKQFSDTRHNQTNPRQTHDKRSEEVHKNQESERKQFSGTRHKINARRHVQKDFEKDQFDARSLLPPRSQQKLPDASQTAFQPVQVKSNPYESEEEEDLFSVVEPLSPDSIRMARDVEASGVVGGNFSVTVTFDQSRPKPASPIIFSTPVETADYIDDARDSLRGNSPILENNSWARFRPEPRLSQSPAEASVAPINFLQQDFSVPPPPIISRAPSSRSSDDQTFSPPAYFPNFTNYAGDPGPPPLTNHHKSQYQAPYMAGGRGPSPLASLPDQHQYQVPYEGHLGQQDRGMTGGRGPSPPASQHRSQVLYEGHPGHQVRGMTDGRGPSPLASQHRSQVPYESYLGYEDQNVTSRRGPSPLTNLPPTHSSQYQGYQDRRNLPLTNIGYHDPSVPSSRGQNLPPQNSSQFQMPYEGYQDRKTSPLPHESNLGYPGRGMSGNCKASPPFPNQADYHHPNHDYESHLGYPEQNISPEQGHGRQQQHCAAYPEEYMQEQNDDFSQYSGNGLPSVNDMAQAFDALSTSQMSSVTQYTSEYEEQPVVLNVDGVKFSKEAAENILKQVVQVMKGKNELRKLQGFSGETMGRPESNSVKEILPEAEEEPLDWAASVNESFNPGEPQLSFGGSRRNLMEEASRKRQESEMQEPLDWAASVHESYRYSEKPEEPQQTFGGSRKNGIEEASWNRRESEDQVPLDWAASVNESFMFNENPEEPQQSFGGGWRHQTEEASQSRPGSRPILGRGASDQLSSDWERRSVSASSNDSSKRKPKRQGRTKISAVQARMEAVRKDDSNRFGRAIEMQKANEGVVLEITYKGRPYVPPHHNIPASSRNPPEESSSSHPYTCVDVRESDKLRDQDKKRQVLKTRKSQLEDEISKTANENALIEEQLKALRLQKARKQAK